MKASNTVVPKTEELKKQADRYTEWRLSMQGLLFTASQAVFARRRYVFQLVVILVAGAFGLLTILAKQIAYFSFDLKITLFIQRIQHPWFDAVMRFLTYMGGPNNVPMYMLGGVVIVLAVFKKFKEGIFLIAATVGSFYISETVKDFVGRTRPNADLIHQVSKFVRNDSFPSGHVMYFVSFYGFLTFLVFILLKKSALKKALMGVFITSILLIGPSRIYLGAHWFSDVLGAYLLGFLWLSLLTSSYIITKPKVKAPEKT